MDEQIRRLRGAVKRLGERKRGRRIPPEVRSLAVDYAVRARARGVTWVRMSRESGLSKESLKRWMSAAGHIPESVAMVPVVVRAGRSEKAEPVARGAGGECVMEAPVAGSLAEDASGAGRALVLVSPGGYRLEGLGLVEARLLLEVLS